MFRRGGGGELQLESYLIHSDGQLRFKFMKLMPKYRINSQVLTKLSALQKWSNSV